MITAKLGRLAGYADYVTLNIFHPTRLAFGICKQMPICVFDSAGRWAGGGWCERPLFVKLAPDLEPGDIEAICARAVARALTG